MADLSDQAPWIAQDPTTSGSERAKKMCRQRNRKEFEASFILPGSVRWSAGTVITLDSSFGSKFARNYRITKVVHRIDKQTGYTTHITCSGVLQGY